MSNLLANYKLLKRICQENEIDSSTQESAINTVNLKGELLVGDGSGPAQLDPSTGSDNDILCLNSGAPQGVQWSTMSPLLPLVQGGYILFDGDNGNGNILPSHHNYYIEMKTTTVPRTVFLPPTNGLPNGFSVWIFANTVLINGVLVKVNNEDSDIESGSVLSYTVSYPNLSLEQEFDKYVYCSTQNRWHRQPLVDYVP